MEGRDAPPVAFRELGVESSYSGQSGRIYRTGVKGWQLIDFVSISENWLRKPASVGMIRSEYAVVFPNVFIPLEVMNEGHVPKVLCALQDR